MTVLLGRLLNGVAWGLMPSVIKPISPAADQAAILTATL